MRDEYTLIIEKGEVYYIGYCPEVPGANGQGLTEEECRASVRAAIRLILEDRFEDAQPGLADPRSM